MNLYEFREPRMAKDDRGRACKPVPPFVGLPGIACDVCGQTWATSLDRIPIDLPEGHPLYGRKGWPVPLAEFRVIASDVRNVLNLPPTTQLLPGTSIGLLRLACVRADIPAFEWPAIHTITITEQLRDLLTSRRLTGWHTAPVVVVKSPKGQPLPKMYQLFIDGRAGAAITDPPVKVLSRCEVCGRVEYAKDRMRNGVNFAPGWIVPQYFGVNLQRWDGSDFLRFDPPFHGYIFVTERVREVLSGSHFDNYELIPIEEFANELAKRAQGL